MLTSVHPKLPMRNKDITLFYYVDKLGFSLVSDYGDYLIVQKDSVEIHFFLFPSLDPNTNYGQVYLRTSAIDDLYEELKNRKTAIHPNGAIQIKPWGQKEFSILDPDNNLLTFGQEI